MDLGWCCFFLWCWVEDGHVPTFWLLMHVSSQALELRMRCELGDLGSFTKGLMGAHGPQRSLLASLAGCLDPPADPLFGQDMQALVPVTA